MNDAVVNVDGVTLAYKLATGRSGSFKDFVVQTARRRISYERLMALDGVSFAVSPGEILAVIGHNGAGKSTLMKILARVLPPTSGRVVVRGAVAPMIELGAGFNGELTARENIVMYGALLGRDPREMRRRTADIIDWAELGDFLDSPVRTFSSGMTARLGFAVATDSSPDLLVVDEVLSVGDEAFQRKSRERMSNLIGSGTAVVLVSHAMETVRKLADHVLWLDHGRVRMAGRADEVVDAYKVSV